MFGSAVCSGSEPPPCSSSLSSLDSGEARGLGGLLARRQGGAGPRHRCDGRLWLKWAADMHSAVVLSHTHCSLSQTVTPWPEQRHGGGERSADITTSHWSSWILSDYEDGEKSGHRRENSQKAQLVLQGFRISLRGVTNITAGVLSGAAVLTSWFVVLAGDVSVELPVPPAAHRADLHQAAVVEEAAPGDEDEQHRWWRITVSFTQEGRMSSTWQVEVSVHRCYWMLQVCECILTFTHPEDINLRWARRPAAAHLSSWSRGWPPPCCPQ